MEPTSENNQNSGFTLVELLVVIPMVIVIIGIIIGMMVSLVGNVVVSNAKTQTIYDTQDALSQIEQDAFLSTAFMSSYTPVSPQGKDNATQAFTGASGNNTDIIFNVFATDKNPLDSGRQIVYYANRPEPCGGNLPLNTPLSTKVIYFLKTVGGVQSLYRRTIVPLNNQNTGAPDGQTTCAKPWQRGSCETANYASSTLCATKDMKLVDNVSTMAVTYFNKSDPATTVSDPTSADSVKVKLTIQKTAAGESVTQDLSLSASRINSTQPIQLPTGPTVSVLGTNSTDYNNPILTTLQWSATNANYYTYSYKINSGSFSTLTNTTSTSLAINMPYSGATVTLRVTAYNDTGASTTTQFVYTTPIWTNMALQNAWRWWGTAGPTTHATPQFTLTPAGLLVMKGMITKRVSGMTGSGEVLFTLPPGLRPSGTIIFGTGSDTAGAGLKLGRVDIVASTGQVQLSQSGTWWTSLDSIMFYPANKGVRIAPSTANGWSNYGAAAGFSPLYYITDDSTITDGTTPLIGQRISLQGIIGRNGSSVYNPVITGIPSIGAKPSHTPIIGDGGPAPVVAGTNISGSTANERTTNLEWVSYQTLYYKDTPASYWQSISYGSDWHAYDAGWLYPGYTKASDNVVTLRGLLAKNSASNGETIFTLPPGYRPAETLFYTTYTGCNTFGMVYINPNGSVVAFGGTLNQACTSLDGISFYADGS